MTFTLALWKPKNLKLARSASTTAKNRVNRRPAAPSKATRCQHSSLSKVAQYSHCNAFLTAHEEKNDPSIALVLLNNVYSPTLLQMLWKVAGFRVCADGGANRLYDVLSEEMIPDIITGDLDSLRPEVGKVYERLGCKIVRDADQNRHDLDKAIHAVLSRCGCDVTLLVLGAFGGRFDHEMAAIQSLYRHTYRVRRMMLVGDKAMSELMLPGRHTVRPNRQFEGSACGLLPIGGGVASITTDGLRWDLNGAPVAFGQQGFVSTSNLLDKSEIQINTTHPVVWCTKVLF